MKPSFRKYMVLACGWTKVFEEMLTDQNRRRKSVLCERGRRSASGSPIYLSAPPVLCQPMSNTLLHFSSAALWNVDTKKGCRANAKADRLQCHPMSNTLHVMLLWSAFLFMVHQLCIEKII